MLSLNLRHQNMIAAESRCLVKLCHPIPVTIRFGQRLRLSHNCVGVSAVAFVFAFEDAFVFVAARCRETHKGTTWGNGKGESVRVGYSSRWKKKGEGKGKGKTHKATGKMQRVRVKRVRWLLLPLNRPTSERHGLTQ